MQVGIVAKRAACCSSPATLCYWLVISLVAWGLLTLIGLVWRPLHDSPAATCLFAMSMGCVANWFKNRSLHCVITGPLFLIAGVVFFLSGAQIIHVTPKWVWALTLAGTAVAFLLEWRFAKRSRPDYPTNG